MAGISTIDPRCCALKFVSSDEPELNGTYRLIPENEVYNDDLPEECSYSCVYTKDGNPDDQFCFQETDPSTSDTFSQCQAGTPSTVPVHTTSSPGQSPVSMTTTTTPGQSPVPMITTTSSPGQSPVSMTTTTPGQSPVPMTTPTTGQSPVPMTTPTPGQSPIVMTTHPSVSMTSPEPTGEETVRLTRASASTVSMPTPTGEEEVRLNPKSRRSTTLSLGGRM
eukprot:TRINITY_DN1712_c0_g1_i1.p1 TRINITY_DN1712_c0_g1~~TRINITY_DN1712_c0_g1_i1.p1  ORF type:complete len:250 (-),score=61.43 TRINITY_DN1712_c0_g1_i1:163-828(-)